MRPANSLSPAATAAVVAYFLTGPHSLLMARLIHLTLFGTFGNPVAQGHFGASPFHGRIFSATRSRAK